MQAAGALILEGLEPRASTPSSRSAEEHRLTLTIGRTHGVHAEPTTFGLKLAVWAFELDRAAERIARALESVRVGKLSGAVGNYAAIDPEVERIACERLGLEPEPAATQVVAARPSRRAALGARAQRGLAGKVRSRDPPPCPNRGRRGAGAVRQGPEGLLRDAAQAEPGRGRADLRACHGSCARAALVGLENVALWHERDISHSSAERVVIPDAFLALDYMLDRFAWLVEGLVVRPERMRKNLESSRGLFFSQRLLLALVDSGLSRDDAYRLVQGHAMRAWEEELDFPELVRADSEIAQRLDTATLDSIFDLDHYTRHVDTIFDRLHALTQKEEPVHV